MADLGSAYVNIVPKAPGIEKELKKLLGDNMPDTSKQGQKLGSGLVSGIKKVVAGAAVGKFIADAFTAGADLQQSFGGLDTIYGDAADAAKEYAKQAATAGISANSYAEQAVSFGAALKQAFGGDTQKAMEAANTAIMDMTDNAAKMGTPIESIQLAYQGFAKQNYTMLDNLKLGYGGTKAEMERLLADAEKLSGVKYDIDNLGDVYDAIHVIQDELGLTGVAAEEASTTLTGSFGAVKASWENVLAALTTGEGFDEAMANLQTSVGNLTDVALKALNEFAPQIPDLIAGIGEVLVENAPDIIANGVYIATKMAAGLINGISEFDVRWPEFRDGVAESFAALDWSFLGTGMVGQMLSGMQSAWEGVKAWWASVKDSLLPGSATINVGTTYHTSSSGREHGGHTGEFATGLNYVPYDEFPALLHQGEMVVPRRLASQMRAAGISKDSQSLPLGVVAAAAPAPTNVTIEFRGSLAQLGRVLQPYIKAEDSRRGPAFVK